MDKKMLTFLLAYAEVHNKMSASVTSVITEVNNIFDELAQYYDSDEAIESYVEEFMDHYHAMKRWGLDEDVRQWMEETGDNFFTTCICEFDI